MLKITIRNDALPMFKEIQKKTAIIKILDKDLGKEFDLEIETMENDEDERLDRDLVQCTPEQASAVRHYVQNKYPICHQIMEFWKREMDREKGGSKDEKSSKFVS